MSPLEEIIETQSKTIETLSNELTLLREQVAYLTQKLYGKSSEKTHYDDNQISLFEDMELSEEDDDLPS